MLYFQFSEESALYPLLVDLSPFIHLPANITEQFLERINQLIQSELPKPLRNMSSDNWQPVRFDRDAIRLSRIIVVHMEDIQFVLNNKPKLITKSIKHIKNLNRNRRAGLYETKIVKRLLRQSQANNKKITDWENKLSEKYKCAAAAINPIGEWNSNSFGLPTLRQQFTSSLVNRRDVEMIENKKLSTNVEKQTMIVTRVNTIDTLSDRLKRRFNTRREEVSGHVETVSDVIKAKYPIPRSYGYDYREL